MLNMGFLWICTEYILENPIMRSLNVSNKGPVLVWDNFFFLVLPIRYILYRDRLRDQQLIPYQEINRPIVERVLLLWPLIMNPNMAGPFWPIDPKIQHLLSFNWFKSLWWIWVSNFEIHQNLDFETEPVEKVFQFLEFYLRCVLRLDWHLHYSVLSPFMVSHIYPNTLFVIFYR